MIGWLTAHLKPLSQSKEGVEGFHSRSASMTSQHTQQQLRYLRLVQPNVPGHAVQSRGRQTPGAGLGPGHSAPGAAETPESPPAPAGASSPTDSVGSQFRSLPDFRPDELPRVGLCLLPHLVLGLIPRPTWETLRPPPPRPCAARTHAGTRPPATHRPRDVVEDLGGGGVPVRTGLRAEQASQLPCAILSGEEGRGAHSLVPEAG